MVKVGWNRRQGRVQQLAGAGWHWCLKDGRGLEVKQDEVLEGSRGQAIEGLEGHAKVFSLPATRATCHKCCSFCLRTSFCDIIYITVSTGFFPTTHVTHSTSDSYHRTWSSLSLSCQLVGDFSESFTYRFNKYWRQQHSLKSPATVPHCQVLVQVLLQV